MTHTRVFVTYLPARGRAAPAMPSSTAGVAAPAMVVLATALLAGASASTLGGAAASASLAASIADPTSDVPQPPPAAVKPLPFLALARTPIPAEAAVAPVERTHDTSERVVPPVTPALRPHVRKPSPPARQRRDLAGFIEEQGYTLAPVPDVPPPVADAGAGATLTLPEPIALPEQEPALAIAPDRPEIAPGALPAAEPDPSPGADQAQTFPTVSVGGAALGAVTMRGDTVHLGGLVGLLKLKMPAGEFERLEASPAAASFVSLDTLRDAGIDVAVDSGGESLSLTLH